MNQIIGKQVQIVRAHVHQLLESDQSSLDEEQSEDIEHILNALDLIEKRLPLLDTVSETDTDRMQILHDLTSPINGIIGYLFILEQGYTSPLTQHQHQLIKSIETQIHHIHQLLSEYLISPQTDS